MVKLIRADIIRLFKNKPFIFFCSFLALLSGAMNYWLYDEFKSGEFYIKPFEVAVYLAFAICVFVLSIIVTNFTNGIIRNKMVAGYSKTRILLSSVVISIVASSILAVLFSTIGIWLCITNNIPLSVLAAIGFSLIVIFTAFAVMTNVFVFITKGAPVGRILLSVFIVLLFYVSSFLSGALTEPETVMQLKDGTQDVIVYTQDFIDENMIAVPNEKYIPEGKKRDIYTAVYDSLPASNILTISDISLDDTYGNEPYCFDIHKIELVPLQSAKDVFSSVNLVYTAIFTVLVLIAGILIFRKEDLK